MRVAIICGAGIVSGKEIMALELGEGLRDAGAEVQVVTSRWGSGDFGRRTEAAGLRTHRMWLGYLSATPRWSEIRMTLDMMRRWPQLAFSYLRFLRKLRPEKVIHTNWHHLLLLWPFLKPGRDIYWVHELMPDKTQYRKLFRLMAPRLGCFVAVSDAAARALIAIGVSPKQVRTIHNGIADPSRETFPAPVSRLSVGIIGQIGAWKGHEDLIDAFHVVNTHHPDAELHIFGKGTPEYESLLRARVESLGLSARVVWHGSVNDRAEIYRKLSIVVAPSRFEEPFGLTALEAAFFGIPVIASNRGGLSEVVQHGVTGLLFEAGNSADLARCLSMLLEDAALRKEMGDRARDRARKHFGRDRFVRGFNELFRSASFLR